jgi:hypothetical protein
MSTMLSVGMAVETVSTAAWTRRREDESQGSFNSILLRKLVGYHE